MNRSYSKVLRSGIGILVSVILASCAVFPPSVTTNVPMTRLVGNTYNSLDGKYTVTIPPLIKPGAIIQEFKESPGTNGVYFADDFGKVYHIFQTDKASNTPNFDLEKFSKEFNVGDLLREKQYITTDRGQELRLVGINKEASPLIERSKVNGKWVERRVDLYEAWSLFIHNDHYYRVRAGVTALTEGSESEVLAQAKKNLEMFLWGLNLKTAKDKQIP